MAKQTKSKPEQPAAPADNFVRIATLASGYALEQAGVGLALAPSERVEIARQVAAHAPGTDWRHIARAVGLDEGHADQRLAIRLVIGVADAILDR